MNGIGGFAMGTACGALTRRYHGLLVASLEPPACRRLLVAKVDEVLGAGGEAFALGVNFYRGAVHPAGYRYLSLFEAYPVPTFVYTCRGWLLEKRAFLVPGENTAVVAYRLLAGWGEARLEVEPFLQCRDYHGVVRRTDWPFRQDPFPGGARVEAYPGAPPVYLSASRGEYRPEGTWYHDFFYPVERERGLEDAEDHYRPGRFVLSLAPGEAAYLVFHCPAGGRGEAAWPWGRPSLVGRKAAAALAARSRGPAGGAVREAGDGEGDPSPARLLLAARAFYARRRSTGRYTLLAGFPWFTDWGRDALIALPGVALIPGRPDRKSVV